MTVAILAWLVAIPLLAGMTGLRTMTPIAVACWFAYKGQLDVSGTWAFWAANPISSIVFALLALGELIGDKLPSTPNRTAPLPLIARVIFGGLVGALGATGLHGAALEGTLLGVIAAPAGAFLGFHLRDLLVREKGFPDLAIAIVEDVLAIGLSFLALGIITG